MRIASLLAPLALVAVLGIAPADASVVRRMSVEDLARGAVTAVDGTVTEKRVVVGPGKGQVWTRYRMKVKETLVGESAATVTFHVAGGRIGNLSQEVHGTASLSRDQRAVVFLWKDSGGRLRVLGLSQGAFRVRADERGRLVCSNKVDDLVLVDHAARRVKRKAVRLTLARLKVRVKAERERIAAEKRRAAERKQRELEARKRAADRNAERLRGRPGGPK